jgi:hypothetical protein
MLKRWLSICAILGLCLSLGAPPAPAAAGPAAYALTWGTVDGGGGRSTGGAYALTVTIGQPDAWNQMCANYELGGGFWGHLAAAGACQHYLPFIRR